MAETRHKTLNETSEAPIGADLVVREALNELTVAKGIVNGEFTSPQRFVNVTLFAMRVTGSGVAFRSAAEEWSYRDPDIFLSDEFLERCNGLPVLFQHTDEPFLTSEEFSDRIVGTLFCPFIRGNEVWAIARIWNDALAVEMATNQWSTSPGVAVPRDSVSVELPEGQTLLIEGKPLLLDHLAVCEQGVWDKSGPPTGVDASTVESIKMADKDDEKDRRDADMEDKGAEQKADRKDADEPSLSEIHAMLKELLSAGKSDKKDKKDSKKDADDCGDAEFIPGEPLPDSEKKDAETSAVVEPDFEVKPSKAAKDADEEKERKDAEEKMEKERKDAAESERKDAEARHDKAMKALRDEMQSKLDAVMASVPRDISDEDRNELSECEARADSVAVMFGRSAPRPFSNEAPMAYRRRIAKSYQKHSKGFAKTNLDALDADTFKHIEADIYAAAKDAARNPDDVKAGTVMPYRTRDDITGLVRTNYRGTFRGGFATFMEGPTKASLRSQKV